MSEPNTVVPLTSVEFAEGTIKSITIPGADGVDHTVQIRIPPGLADGTLLRIPAPEGEHYVRVSLEATPPPTATPPPGFATPPIPPPGFATPSTPPPGFAAPPPATPPPGFAAPPNPAFGPSARSRRRIVLVTGAVAAVVVIVVALITANSGPAQPGTPTPNATQQAAPPAPTTTTQPPESAADYQQALTRLATVLNNGFTELNNAQTPEAISTAVSNLSTALYQAVGPIYDAVPPTGTEAAHEALVSALKTLILDDLRPISDAATSDQVCLGSAATALLSRAASLDQLRQATTTLTAAGYQFGASIPPVTQDGARTASTGAIVAGGVKHGLGQLTITNGGDTDATVGIVAGQGPPLVTVYMGRGGTYTLHHIPDGTYTIYVTSGDDWDGGARLFSRNCDFEQFDQTMEFTTTSTQYTTYTLTLTPVAGGNASESSVDPGSFPH